MINYLFITLYNDKSSTKDYEKAQIFNEYFYSVFNY